jgi:hypothetical protein
MLRLSGRFVGLLPVVWVLAGCATPEPKGKSPLLPAQMSSDSVVLEIFRAHFPFGDPLGNEQLWQEVDEQHFSQESRQRLGRNGFRLGLVGGQPPEALSELLELEDKPPRTGQANQIDVAEMDCQPLVERRHMQLRSGRRGEIVTSAVYDQLPVLLSESGELFGETYAKAQTLLAVKAFPLSDGRVRVELVPELYHDESRQTWVAGQGTFRLEAGRPRQAFDELGFSAVLSPGSMLLVSSLPNRPGSLGHHFFTHDDGQPQQKLLVVRLAQTQHDDLFAPSEVEPPEETAHAVVGGDSSRR